MSAETAQEYIKRVSIPRASPVSEVVMGQQEPEAVRRLRAKLDAGQELDITDYTTISKYFPDVSKKMAAEQKRYEAVKGKLEKGESLDVLDAIWLSSVSPQTSKAYAAAQRKEEDLKGRIESLQGKLATDQPLDIYDAILLSSRFPEVAKQYKTYQEQKAAYERSRDFWTALGYPQYAGKYAPVEIPEGMTILSAEEPIPSIGIGMGDIRRAYRQEDLSLSITLVPEAYRAATGEESFQEFYRQADLAEKYGIAVDTKTGEYKLITKEAAEALGKKVGFFTSEDLASLKKQWYGYPHSGEAVSAFPIVELAGLAALTIVAPQLTVAGLVSGAIAGGVKYGLTRELLTGTELTEAMLIGEASYGIGSGVMKGIGDVAPFIMQSGLGRAAVQAGIGAGLGAGTSYVLSGGDVKSTLIGAGLGAGIGAGTSLLADYILKPVAHATRVGLGKAGGFIYEKAIEPRVASLSKTILGEESYAYYHGVEGLRAVELLKLGLSEHVLSPVYSGIQDILPSYLTEPVMFGKSVLLPNIRDLGSVLETNVLFQGLRSGLSDVREEILSPIYEAQFRPIAQSLSVGKGGISFLLQSEGQIPIFGEMGVTLENAFGIMLKPLVTDLKESFSLAKGGVSFMWQSPSETKAVLGDIWTGYIGRPIDALVDYEKTGEIFAKVSVAQAKFKAGQIGSILSESLLPFREIASTMKQSAQTVLLAPLEEAKAASKIGMGSLRYWMPIGLNLLKVGITTWMKPVDLNKTVLSVKPWTWTFPAEKKLVSPLTIKLEQPKPLKSGIRPFISSTQLSRTILEEPVIEAYPTQRLTRAIQGAEVVFGETLTPKRKQVARSAVSSIGQPKTRQILKPSKVPAIDLGSSAVVESGLEQALLPKQSQMTAQLQKTTQLSKQILKPSSIFLPLRKSEDPFKLFRQRKAPSRKMIKRFAVFEYPIMGESELSRFMLGKAQERKSRRRK